jgi:hypothetical protein
MMKKILLIMLAWFSCQAGATGFGFGSDGPYVLDDDDYYRDSYRDRYYDDRRPAARSHDYYRERDRYYNQRQYRSEPLRYVPERQRYADEQYYDDRRYAPEPRRYSNDRRRSNRGYSSRSNRDYDNRRPRATKKYRNSKKRRKRKSGFRGFSFKNPKKSMRDMWDDSWKEPVGWGRMPGGWTFPEVTLPNPVDTADDFEKGVRDLPEGFRQN